MSMSSERRPPALAPRRLAHPGRPHDLEELLRTWSWEPVVVASLTLSAALYFRGLSRLWRESEAGRGIRQWEASCYALGWLVLFVALVSPLHPWGRVLFSAHMTQHELLMLVAAPLMVLGRPLVPYLWALPIGWRRGLGAVGRAPRFRSAWRAVSHPLSAWAIHAALLWVWHAPALFQSAVDDELVHFLQHLCFFLPAMLFWWALVHGRRGLAGYGAAVLYLFTTMVHSGALGALITVASGVIYPVYGETTASWGLTPLEDQQLAGLVMWIPFGVVYVVAGLALFAGWMRESERRVLRREARLGLEQE